MTGYRQWSFPMAQWQRILLQCRRHRRHGLDLWLGNIPWRKGMATHSSILAWRIPWIEEPGGLQSLEWQSRSWPKQLNRTHNTKMGWTGALVWLGGLIPSKGGSTHLEPDIPECEVKWGLGSISVSKASGGDGILAELLQILKDDAIKVLHSIYQQIWKTQQGPQDWERSVFIPIPKKGNAKECSNYHTIALVK